jgi:endonuclease I
MKKRLGLLFSLLFLVSCTPTGSSSSSSTSSSSSSSSSAPMYYEHTYYDDILLTTSGTTLKGELRTLITSTHKTQTTYGDLRNYLKNSDKVESGKMQTFYAHAEINGTWDNGTTYDREHVWPKANSWFSKVSNSDKGAGADLHHIRPTIPKINNTRGYLPFGDFDETKATKVMSGEYLGGYTSNGFFEPLDHSKGDVARIIFYLVTRYSESDSYAITKVAQSYEMLLLWNELDPVDEVERNRNEYTYSIQGNRNPFIDYPEMANKIWG